MGAEEPLRIPLLEMEIETFHDVGTMVFPHGNHPPDLSWADGQGAGPVPARDALPGEKWGFFCQKSWEKSRPAGVMLWSAS